MGVAIGITEAVDATHAATKPTHTDEHSFNVPRPTSFWRFPAKRVDGFVGRAPMMTSMADYFWRNNKSLVIEAADGMGKTALCREFVNHFSTPGGRLFSAGAFLLDCERLCGERSRGVDDGKTLAADIVVRSLLGELRAASGGIASIGSLGAAAGPEPLYAAVREAARQFDRECGRPWLIVVDGMDQLASSSQGSAT